MAENPRVSVIIPVYQAQQFIGQCLDSVLCQTLKSFEIICVDDGSTDDTCSVIDSRAVADARIRLMRQQNTGPGVARNAALEQVRGDYIYCLDADDFLERDMLSSCVQALDETKADVVLFTFCTYNQQCSHSFFAEWSMRKSDVYPNYPKGTFSWQTCPDHFFEVVQNVPWNKMVRTRLLKSQKICFQNLYLSEDMMYSIPAAIKAESIVRIARPLVHHREYVGTNAMSHKDKHPLDFLKAFEALRQWLDSEGLYDELRVAYGTWLLDAIYYNVPTYESFEGFAGAYDYLTANSRKLFVWDDLEDSEVCDLRYRALLQALRLSSREQFLLACLNIATKEVQDQRSGFQERQTSFKWITTLLRERFKRK